MKNWQAVSIGIKKAGEMAELPGAVNGAKEFAAWAEGNDYQPTLFTDEKGPVFFSEIRAAIEAIVEECRIDFSSISRDTGFREPTGRSGSCPVGKRTKPRRSMSSKV